MPSRAWHDWKFIQSRSRYQSTIRTPRPPTSQRRTAFAKPSKRWSPMVAFDPAPPVAAGGPDPTVFDRSAARVEALPGAGRLPRQRGRDRHHQQTGTVPAAYDRSDTPGGALKRGCVYIVPLQGRSSSLPAHISGKANPKSSHWPAGYFHAPDHRRRATGSKLFRRAIERDGLYAESGAADFQRGCAAGRTAFAVTFVPGRLCALRRAAAAARDGREPRLSSR